MENMNVQSDQDPLRVVKPADQNIHYKQQVNVRFLQPPSGPEPAPIIIKERQAPAPPAPPPVVIRQRPQTPPTPPPLIIRKNTLSDFFCRKFFSLIIRRTSTNTTNSTTTADY
jgi:hypothetical protein